MTGDLPPGTALGNYRITGTLGRGGMGVVYEAKDVMIGRKVAIKLLPEKLAADRASLKRFLQEARAAGRLNHPNAVGIHYVGEHKGRVFLVLELVPGGSAEDYLYKRGKFNWPEATRIITDACRGLAAAHHAGLVHRDIKPANIMRAKDGTVKLADFGLATPSARVGETSADVMVGTPMYLSPEQCDGKPADARSDLYALGATYYALLTGKPPYPHATTVVQCVYSHCFEPTPDPRELVPEVPAACVAVINRAMSKDPDERYRTADEMLAELEGIDRAVREGTATSASAWKTLPPDQSDGSLPGLTTTSMRALRPPPARGGPPPWLIFAAAGGGAVAAAVVVAAVMLRGNAEPKPAVPAAKPAAKAPPPVFAEPPVTPVPPDEPPVPTPPPPVAPPPPPPSLVPESEPPLRPAREVVELLAPGLSGWTPHASQWSFAAGAVVGRPAAAGGEARALGRLPSPAWDLSIRIRPGAAGWAGLAFGHGPAGNLLLMLTPEGVVRLVHSREPSRELGSGRVAPGEAALRLITDGSGAAVFAEGRRLLRVTDLPAADPRDPLCELIAAGAEARFSAAAWSPLGDGPPDRPARILAALSRFKPAGAAEQLRTLLTEPFPGGRPSPAEILQVMRTIKSPETLKALRQFAEAAPGPADAVCVALESLTDLPDPAAAAGIAENRLSHPDEGVRRAAALTLARVAPEAVHKIVPLLADRRVEVRRSAVEALALMAPDRAVPHLVGALGDPWVRRDAAAALVRMPSPAALPGWLAAMDQDEALAGKAVEALRNAGDAALPAVLDAAAKGRLTATSLLRTRAALFPARFVEQWKVLGPFPPEAVRTVLDPAAFGKAPDLAGEYPAEGGRTVRWIDARTAVSTHIMLDHTVPLHDLFGTAPGGAYAYAAVEADADGEVELQFRADDDITIWVNGERVAEARQANKTYLRAAARLRKGTNHLLLRVDNALLWWHFSVAVAAKATPDVLWSPPVLTLYEDDPVFASLMGQTVLGVPAPVSLEGLDVCSGTSAVRYGPPGMQRFWMPNWRFPLSTRNEPGHYRYLRFAWKKIAGRRATIVIFLDYSYKVRYRVGFLHAGDPMGIAAPPGLVTKSVQVGASPPTEWKIETVDLGAEFDGNSLVGIGVIVEDGEALLLDHVFLSRSLKDLKAAVPRPSGR
jgi:tRNA A-37 threonylcarbamoyl transferase component Bud32